MRIVYVDLHETNFLCRTLPQIKVGNKIHTFKHRFIIDYLHKNGFEIFNYVSGEYPKGRRDKFINMIKPSQEKNVAEFVIKENGLDNTVNNLLDASQIKSGDIVIGYFYNTYQRDLIPKLPGHKILFGNHFIRIDGPVSFVGKNIEAFVNEIDLSDNEFVKKFFDLGDTKMLTCPFAFEDRFEVRRKFDDRKNKLLAIGTLSTVAYTPGYDLYEKWAGTPWVQMMRKEIFDHADEYPDFIDSCISYIYEDKKPILDTDNWIVKTQKKFYNKRVGWQQKKYTSFDMVDKFNEYRMFVCPEEQVGMPGIGFVEGMACGGAYIGLNHSMYKCLGLVPGVHYITYDGTLPGLIETVKYYQSHGEECAQIAKAGSEYVRVHFNQKAVAEQFIKDLSELVK